MVLRDLEGAPTEVLMQPFRSGKLCGLPGLVGFSGLGRLHLIDFSVCDDCDRRFKLQARSISELPLISD